MLFSKSVLLSLAFSIFTEAAALPTTDDIVARDELKFVKLDFEITKSVQGDSLGHLPKAGPGALVKRLDSEEFTLFNEQTYYSLVIGAGSNNQPQTLDIDTGSSDLWVINKDAKCLKNDCKTFGVFDSTTSTTYKKLNEEFSITYQDGSGSSGYYAKDDFTLQSGHKLKQLQFGDVNSTSIEYGLIGVGYKSLVSTNNKYDNFPILLKKQGIINVNGYSLYLNKKESNTGSVIFGAYDTTKVTGNFPTLPITSKYYLSVNLPSVQVKKSKINVAGPALLDSGTTLTYLPKAAFNAIGKALGATYYPNIDLYVYSCNQPSDEYLTYNFNGVSIKVPLSDLPIPLLVNGVKSNEICAVGIISTPAKDEYGKTLSILGDNFLRSSYAVFNLDANTIRLGQASYSTSENLAAI